MLYVNFLSDFKGLQNDNTLKGYDKCSYFYIWKEWIEIRASNLSSAFWLSHEHSAIPHYHASDSLNVFFVILFCITNIWWQLLLKISFIKYENTICFIYVYNAYTYVYIQCINAYIYVYNEYIQGCCIITALYGT